MRNLSLEQKHAAVKMVVYDKIKVKDVAKHFDCGKTQIYQALKNRNSIEENIHHNKNGKKKKIRMQRTVELNEAVFEWYRTMKARNLPVNGPMLQQKAIELAHYLNVENFRASNGWLDSFRKNRRISFKTESAETDCNDSDMNVKISITSELENIASDYEPKDIANVDEMALFFRALPKSIMSLKGETCALGNMANERITVLLTVFGDGKIWKPLVVGKSGKPLSFKNIEKNQLPIIYRQNSKAWMTTAIFKEYLHMLNRQMILEERKILLLLDDAACHVNIKLSNINLVFLPENCASVPMPLDVGISQCVKVHYRKIMLQKLISLSNTCTLNNHKINVLDAIMMLLQAIKKLTATYIERTFKSCGFLVEATEIQAQNLNMLELEDLLQNSHFADADLPRFTAPDYLAIDENLITEIDCGDISMHFLPSDDEDEFDSDSSDIAEKVTPLASSVELFMSLSTLKNYALLKSKFSMYEKLEDIQFEIEKEHVKPKITKQTALKDPVKDPLS